MNKSPPTIGLTGGIGSGKSTIASCFEQLGCIVANADENAKIALQTGEVRRQLVDWWGSDILNHDGRVNTSAVAAIIFKDGITHCINSSLNQQWSVNNERFGLLGCFRKLFLLHFSCSRVQE